MFMRGHICFLPTEKWHLIWISDQFPPQIEYRIFVSVVVCTDWQFLLVGLNMMLINISWCVGGAGGAGVCISLAGPEPSLNTVRPYSLHSTHFSSQPALSVFSTVEQTGLSDTVSDQTEITVLTRNRVTSRKCPDLTSRGVE